MTAEYTASNESFRPLVSPNRLSRWPLRNARCSCSRQGVQRQDVVPWKGTMTILITVGAGLIGSHLAERCLKEGWKVAVSADLSTGAIENISPLRVWGTFSYHIGSG